FAEPLRLVRRVSFQEPCELGAAPACRWTARSLVARSSVKGARMCEIRLDSDSPFVHQPHVNTTEGSSSFAGAPIQRKRLSDIPLHAEPVFVEGAQIWAS